jgi:hypothetical protein
VMPRLDGIHAGTAALGPKDSIDAGHHTLHPRRRRGAGADDYLVKPLASVWMLARGDAHLKRTRSSVTNLRDKRSAAISQPAPMSCTPRAPIGARCAIWSGSNNPKRGSGG